MDKSLYSQYISERSDDKIIEMPGEGFATYRYINGGKSVYIIDIFVTPEARHGKIASGLADIISNEAKERGCKEVLGSVCPSAKGSTTSLKVLLAYGMKLQSSSDNFIVFSKEIA
jgi:hypothetical protein